MSLALISWFLLQFIVRLVTWRHNLMLSILFLLFFSQCPDSIAIILVRKYHYFNCCILCCCWTALIFVILSKFGIAFFLRTNINMDTDISFAIFIFIMSIIFSLLWLWLFSLYLQLLMYWPPGLILLVSVPILAV